MTVLAVLYDVLTWVAVVAAGLLVWALLAVPVGVAVGRMLRDRDERG